MCILELASEIYPGFDRLSCTVCWYESTVSFQVRLSYWNICLWKNLLTIFIPDANMLFDTQFTVKLNYAFLKKKNSVVQLLFQTPANISKM